jgi:glycosyltransferase involved in cell wall biosynthesis
MEIILFLLAAATLTFLALFGIDLMRGNRSTAYLSQVASGSDLSRLRVSVLIPARNEARKVGEALQSVLSQDYSNLEVIVVNDRSSDGTGAILSRMEREDSRLRIIELTSLPEGWLGKNYALFRASESATGDLFLFSDADVVMDPTTISRAVACLQLRKLGHLAVMPEVRMPGRLLGMFCSAFGIFFSAYARPWKAKDRESKQFVGIGAFNLVAAEAYRAAGTHRSIAMRPDDDMKLGKILKRNGCHQEMVFGNGLIRVEWYSSLPELIDGLMKNSFAGVEYSVPFSILAGIAVLVAHVWPFAAVFLTHGPTRLLNLAVVALMLLIITDTDRFYCLPRYYALGHPFCSLIFVYILWKSTLLALWNGGIRWRGTHYPLGLLKANRV